MKTALVCGAGGFIGSHMVNRLKSEGYWVRGVDTKEPEFSKTQADEFVLFNLVNQSNYQILVHSSNGKQEHFDEIYQFAADMGGAGYVFTGDHDADIMYNSAMINLNILSQLQRMDFKGKIFYSSSACMYPEHLQRAEYEQHVSLNEGMAYPARPDSEYGWEKLFSERLYLAYARNYGIDIRIARFHNIYGPEGTYKGGREKAPAAICRKVIEQEIWFSKEEKKGFVFSKGDGLKIELWGDGNQTRSFLYIDDCIDAVRLLVQSDFKEPINIGSEEMVSINDLARIVIGLSGKQITINHIEGPQGVRGRNSDNTLIRKVLGWEPKFNLIKGIGLTFQWIKSQYDRD